MGKNSKSKRDLKKKKVISPKTNYLTGESETIRT